MLGVHSWEHCGGDDEATRECRDGSDFPRQDRQHALHGEYVEAMLGSRDFYWFSLDAAPTNGIHWLSAEEALRYAIAEPTAPIVGATFPDAALFEAERRKICGLCAPSAHRD